MSFIPDLTVLIAFAAASLVVILTPGPDMTLFVGRALSDGRGAALACVAGTSTGLLVHTVLVALGISALIVASPAAFLVLKTGGALYLLWLALRAIRGGAVFQIEGGETRGRSPWANWTQGAAVNLLNPKIIIFFMTFLPQFVSADDPHVSGKLLFLGVFFTVFALPFLVVMVLAAERLAGWLRGNRRVMRTIDYVFAAVFSVFAVRILLTEGR